MSSSDSNLTQDQPVYLIVFPVKMPYLAVTILSCVSTFAVIVVAIMLKAYKKPLGTMILGITISDFVFTLTKTMGSIFIPQTGFLCNLLQTICLYGIVSSVMWGAFFGHALLITSKTFQVELLEKYKKYYIVFGSITTLGYEMLNLLTNNVEYLPDETGVVRCIHITYPGTFDYAFSLFLTFPVLSGIILSVIWYVKAAKNLRVLIKGDNVKHLLTLIVYPAIMLICWFPLIAVNALSQFGVAVSLQLQALVLAFAQMQGLINALVYGVSMNTLVANTLCFCCFQKKKNRIRDTIEIPTTNISRNQSSLSIANNLYPTSLDEKL